MAEQTNGIEVLCAGMLIADTFVPPLAELPASGSLIEVSGFISDAGGSSANTAITLAKLGVRSGIAATVGDDAVGIVLRDSLETRGVDVAGVQLSERRATSRTVILGIGQDDRRYIHEVGANADFNVAAIESALGNARVLVIGGFFALPGLDVHELAALLKRARLRGVKTMLDIVVPLGEVDATAAMRVLLPHVDFFLPNSDEAEALTGLTDAREQALALLDWGCQSVVITRGGDGAIYADAASVLSVSPLPVELVDPSGAGDAFTAGLVVGVLERWPAERSLRFAAALGASACRALGCTTAVFTRHEAEQESANVVIRR